MVFNKNGISNYGTILVKSFLAVLLKPIPFFSQLLQFFNIAQGVLAVALALARK